MKVTGFTFIRNAVKYDFPVIASITSILPVCTDFVVVVGKSDDDTLSLLRSIPSTKIRIIESEWDDNLREGGKVLAVETNKALSAIDPDTDWCFYLQADEVIHERDLPTIEAGMMRYHKDHRVDGLLFKYLHFYGSYNYTGTDPSLYRNEIRVIRNDRNIYSYRDAQGFRKGDNKKLNVKEIDAFVYHYGYVKNPVAMQRKHEEFGRLWNSDEWLEKHVIHAKEFDYSLDRRPLSRFKGTHPAVIENRVQQQNWNFEPDIAERAYNPKQKMKIILEKLGLNLSYTNYKLICLCGLVYVLFSFSG